ncbi:MAG: 3-hydroxyacyl-CoA dehydrogenase NAD-binding domain-containing protein [Pseudomonadota bacterium]
MINQIDEIVFKHVAIIGAGQMGRGIAQIIALSGSNIQLIDHDQQALDQALEAIKNRLDQQVKRDRITTDTAHKTLKHIALKDDLEKISNFDLAIETISEDEGQKRSILKKLSTLAHEDALITTNTSSIPITRLASNLTRPENFCGMHFMNPAPAMGLVELIRGLTTSVQTFNTIERFVSKQLKRQIAVAEDFPGFIVNRILMPMINEAIYALYEGVGSVDSIDRAMCLGTGHPQGPLTLADFIGLDTCLAILNVLFNDLHDDKYRPCPLLIKYVEASWLGVKTSRGFYDYTGKKPKPTR